jgi:hypothetical protein
MERSVGSMLASQDVRAERVYPEHRCTVGYLKRNVDRGRMRALVRALDERGAALRPWRKIPDRPPKTACFLRFATHVRHLDSLCRTGIFAATYRVLEKDDVDRALALRLRAHLDWFGANLASPGLDEDRAVFLFKSEAIECTRRIWDLVHALREVGVLVQMQVYEKPGRIVYEDALQVAVIPWADAKEL